MWYTKYTSIYLHVPTCILHEELTYWGMQYPYSSSFYDVKLILLHVFVLQNEQFPEWRYSTYLFITKTFNMFKTYGQLCDLVSEIKLFRIHR